MKTLCHSDNFGRKLLVGTLWLKSENDLKTFGLSKFVIKNIYCYLRTAIIVLYMRTVPMNEIKILKSLKICISIVTTCLLPKIPYESEVFGLKYSVLRIFKRKHAV